MPGDSIFYEPKTRQKDIQKKRWKPLHIIWQAIKRTCTALGAMVLILSIYGAFATYKIMNAAAPPLPNEMILVLKLEKGITETPPEASFTNLIPSQQPTVRQVVNTLDQAKDDARVKGLIFSIKSGGISLAHIQEIRAAVKRFRTSGKFAYIYSASYGDYGTGLSLYYLASAFEQIWMQPVGLLAVTGVHAEMPFLRGTLDKIGIMPQFLQREGYKTAYESLQRIDMSPENREMMQAIVDDYATLVVSDVAKDRGLNAQELKAYIDKGLLTGEEALEAGLIDALDYSDVLIAKTKELATGDPEDKDIRLIPMQRYAADKVTSMAHAAIGSSSGQPQVALIYATGIILPTRGGSQYGDDVAAADEISAAISDAAENEDIEAIVLRVNSPGGSPTASETIRRALVRAQEKYNKIVIVSMGPVAASGGYWIAADADQIFALPTTLTGSIGVVMGKMALTELWTKIGANWETISWGANSGIFSPNAVFNEAEYARMDALIESVYQAFLKRVAQGRGMSVEEARGVAQGRAWTGWSALNKNLVDQLGGLDDALDYTAVSLGVKDRSRINVQILPRPKSTVEQIFTLLGQQAYMSDQLQTLERAAQFADPLLKSLQTMQNAQDYMVYDPGLQPLQ